ncbi:MULTISPECIES: 3-oxoacid CoA-transferase subunit B [Bacillaceae]|uniref:Acetate CoA/acetoacetate CoA-transferase beta subunit n=1 Tax=Peribacillus huizhouensis TaxID=1501239 RepID=A0ABR6CRP5_9BACI|nr:MULTISPECIES: 3-oxoacid CoA-transferase subunit B [Bacillaceae]MBA9027697.1 acetate CoA/acetoacetate CoA-transferase beta subunit [Peribacillus huizhouensis]
MGMGAEIRKKLAKRAAQEIKQGMLVNLGIGIPSLVPDFLPKNFPVMFHAENGIIGMGPSPESGKEDGNLCNAGGHPVTLQTGGSYCDSATAFGIIRSERIDLTILGALQVSGNGDLANWIVPGKRIPGMGGAMDLAAKAKKVIVVMNHFDKSGASKLVKACTLPLTAPNCVHMIITELGVFTVTFEGLVLTDLFETYTFDDVVAKTDTEVKRANHIRIIKER